MKKVYTLIFILCFYSFAANAQCSGGTLQGAITPTAAWQTITTHSDKYLTFAGTAGTVYIFSYCSCDGGSCNYAVDLTIDTNTTGFTVYGNNFSTNYNADNSSVGCSTTITWRCNANATYRVLTNVDPCAATTGKTATMAYIAINPSVCYTVTNPAYTFDTYNSGTAFTGTGIDDGFANTIPIGFQFCYNGIFYDSVIMSTNGYIIFKQGNCDSLKKKSGNFSSYTTCNIPFTDGTTTAWTTPAVMFPWIDAYPVAGGTLVHKIYGVAPNRHLTISWNKVPLFQCTGKKITTQVQLYETNYKIQVNYDTVPYCASWGPGGSGTLGLVDSTGFAAVVAPGRQRSNLWRASQQSWLFTPSCCPVPLPVQLTGFTCSPAGNGINLFWGTATEVNNRYFTLQRSLDGINFTTIWQGPGAGNSDKYRSYSYLDTNTMSGTNYYRLQQTDFDGKTTTFNTISCTSGKQMAGNIFPNPASESFTVTIGPSDNTQTLTIYDLVGRAVHTENFDPQSGFENHVVHVPSLKGVYFVEITGWAQSIIRKVVLK